MESPNIACNLFLQDSRTLSPYQLNYPTNSLDDSSRLPRQEIARFLQKCSLEPASYACFQLEEPNPRASFFFLFFHGEKSFPTTVTTSNPEDHSSLAARHCLFNTSIAVLMFAADLFRSNAVARKI
jgi:hypothetical protein